MILLVLFIVFFVGPCVGQKMRTGWSHFRSGTVGINRTITWVAPDGTRKEWSGKIHVEYIDGYARIVLENGKTVSIAPGICIEEQ